MIAAQDIANVARACVWDVEQWEAPRHLYALQPCVCLHCGTEFREPGFVARTCGRCLDEGHPYKREACPMCATIEPWLCTTTWGPQTWMAATVRGRI